MVDENASQMTLVMLVVLVMMMMMMMMMMIIDHHGFVHELLSFSIGAILVP